MYEARNDLNGLLLRDVRWNVKTAGPSPYNNERTEIFLLGCKKAMSGNPCKGCFNSSTWDASKAEFSHDPIEMAKHINNNAPNKYITIGGGEPTDQIDNLIILCKELKKYEFHIMMYTWRELLEIFKPYYAGMGMGDANPRDFSRGNTGFRKKVSELLQYVDIIVDGQYKEEERLWDDTKEDGLISSVGSGNQVIWDIKNKRGFAMKDIDTIFITASNSLQFILKDLDAGMYRLK